MGYERGYEHNGARHSGTQLHLRRLLGGLEGRVPTQPISARRGLRALPFVSLIFGPAWKVGLGHDR